MAGTFTNGGLTVLLDRLHDDTANGIEAVALGDGTSPVSATDTAMQNELHRGAFTRVDTPDSTTREFVISVTGGTEIPADSTISEFGLFNSTTAGAGTLIYHEVRNPVTVRQGVTVEFIVPVSIGRKV